MVMNMQLRVESESNFAYLVIFLQDFQRET